MSSAANPNTTPIERGSGTPEPRAQFPAADHRPRHRSPRHDRLRPRPPTSSRPPKRAPSPKRRRSTASRSSTTIASSIPISSIAAAINTRRPGTPSSTTRASTRRPTRRSRRRIPTPPIRSSARTCAPSRWCSPCRRSTRIATTRSSSSTCTRSTSPMSAAGRRATTRAAYLLAGPDWHGETPPGVKAVIRSETEFAFVIYRTQLFGPDDIDNVKKIQAGYKVQPLSQFLGKPAPPAPPAVDFIKPLSPEAERTSPEFFTILNFVLGFCPPNPAETEIMARFAKLGIGPHGTFDAKALSPEMLKAVEDGMADAWAQFKTYKETELDTGKRTSADAFGTREFLNGDYLARFSGAVLGIYGNSKDEAIYPLYFVDSAKKPLSGANRYELRFAPGDLPPVNAFWSLTLYELPSSLLSANPLNRYLINSAMLPGLKRDDDGGVTLAVQHADPGADGRRTGCRRRPVRSSWSCASIGRRPTRSMGNGSRLRLFGRATTSGGGSGPGRRRSRHARKFRSRRERPLSRQSRQGGRHRQAVPSPGAGGDRQPDRHPAQPRYALFVGSVRPRRRAGDDHAAGRGQAVHVDAGDRRGRIHAVGRLRRRDPDADQGEGRNALRRGRGPDAGQSGRSQGPRGRPCAPGRDQGRSAGGPGQVRGSRIGIRPARRRCATGCSRWLRPCPTPRACSARGAGSIRCGI